MVVYKYKIQYALRTTNAMETTKSVQISPFLNKITSFFIYEKALIDVF